MITCTITAHSSPEILDRMIAPFRKRGILPQSVDFKQIDTEQCVATIFFDPRNNPLHLIEKNLLRMVDIQTVLMVT